MVAILIGEIIAYGDRSLIGCMSILSVILIALCITKEERFMKITNVAIMLVCVCAGFYFMSNHIKKYESISELQYVRGTIQEVNVKEKGSMLIFKTEDKHRILLFCDIDSELIPGDDLEGYVTLEGFEAARNEGNFDEKTYYQSIGIEEKYRLDRITKIRKNKSSLKKYVYLIKNVLKKRLHEIYPKEEASVAEAVLLGEKTDVDEDTKEIYRVSGILHLLSISGTHMTIIGMGIYRILRKKFRYGFSGVVGISVIMLYGILTGLGISVKRAVIMLIIKIMADILGRTYDMMSALSCAGIIMITDNPYVIMNAGFLLSFTSIIALSCGCTVITEFFSVESKLLKGFVSGICINIFILPVIASSYYEVPVYAVLINILAIPLASYLIVSSGMALLAAFADISAGIFMAGLSVFILKIYDTAGRFVLRLPYSEYITGKPGSVRVTLYYAILFITLIILDRTGNEGRKFWEEKASVRYVKILGSMLVVGVLCMLIIYRGDRKFKICSIDVGQGDSTLIMDSDDTEYLIDAGSSSIKEVGKYRILPCLKSNGVRELDYLILTHMDEDHINGVHSIMEEKVGNRNYLKNLVMPEIKEKDSAYMEIIRCAKKNHINVMYISRGNSFRGSRYHIECLYPYKNASGTDKNELSVVLRLDYKKFSMMFMGDLGEEGEKELIKNNCLKKVTALKAGHHGSKNSGCKRFLDIIMPSVTMISAGRNNRYGHPHIETLNRLNDINSKVFLTITGGQIILYPKEKGVKVDYYMNKMYNER